MLNSNFSLAFNNAYKNFLIFSPVLNDISLWWEKTAKADVVLEVVFQTVSQFVFVQDSLHDFVVFEFVFGQTLEHSDYFIQSSRIERNFFIQVGDLVCGLLRFFDLSWFFFVSTSIIFLNISDKFVLVSQNLFNDFFTSLVKRVMRLLSTAGIALRLQVLTVDHPGELGVFTIGTQNVLGNEFIQMLKHLFVFVVTFDDTRLLHVSSQF